MVGRDLGSRAGQARNYLFGVIAVRPLGPDYERWKHQIVRTIGGDRGGPKGRLVDRALP